MTIAAKHNPFAAANQVNAVSITVAAEAADSINVALVFRDAKYNAKRGACRAYLSDNADGSNVAGTAPDTVAIGTNGLAIELVTKKVWELVPNANGLLDLAIGENGADTWYLVVILPDGSLVISGAITFAA
jgi:hypothetical protein